MSAHGLQKEKFAIIFYEILDNLLAHSIMGYLSVVPLTFHHING